MGLQLLHRFKGVHTARPALLGPGVTFLPLVTRSATTACNPADCIKSRVMVSRGAVSVVAAAVEIFQQHGVMGFMRGWLPVRWLCLPFDRAPPNCF